MKKVKKLLVAICTLSLACCLVIGAVGSIPLFSTVANASTPAITAVGSIDSVKIQKTVDYGNDINVPAASGFTVKVIAPNGAEANIASNKVKADQVGFYSVIYSKDNASYAFDVYSSLAEENIKLVVDANGADIPSYIAKGAELTLPMANLYYVEDGKNVLVPADDYKIVVSVSSESAQKKPGDKITFNNVGKVFVTYDATLANGNKHFDLSFTINVQESFEDTVAPKLNVTNVVTSANINKKFTLPTASATDNFDSNVRIDVTVTDPSGNPAKEVEVKDDIAVKELADDVKFDNNNVVAFYPTKKGNYKITYVAVDDANNKSAKHIYNVEVSDKKAPEFISIADESIPSTWAKSVFKKDGSALTDTSITFPKPVVVDNSDDKVIIQFVVKDPNNKYAVDITNINSDTEGERKSSMTIGDNHFDVAWAKDADNVKFDLNSYIAMRIAEDDKLNYYGDYVVTYTIKDSAGNRQTKSYTIKMQDEFTDDEEVTVKLDDLPEYILLDNNNNEFVVPSPITASAKDSRLDVKYTLSMNGEMAVKGGDVLVYKDNKLSDKKDPSKSVTVSDTMTLKVVATANSGNSSEITKTIAVKSTSSSVLFNTVDTSAVNAPTNLVVGKEVDFGNVNVAVAKANVPYVGVELNVVNANGEDVKNVEADILWANGKKFINNIKFFPQSAGKYTLSIRIFDIYNNSNVSLYTVDVADQSGDDSESNPSALPTSGKVLTTYTLNNKTFTKLPTLDSGYAYATVHNVKGGKFALMGTELVCYTATTYSVEDRPMVVKADTADGADVVSELTNADYVAERLALYRPSYNINVTADTNYVFEVQGVMPVISAKNAEIVLPAVVAYSTTGNKVVKKPTISYKSGNVSENKIVEFNGGYKFTPEYDGIYTITYALEGATATKEFKISVGDVIAPTFKLVASHDDRAKVDSVFKFQKVEITSIGDDVKDITFTKTLIGPDGTEIKNISGNDTKYRDMQTDGNEIVLDKSGKYTVVYKVSDKVGNESVQKFEINVTQKAKSNSTSLTALSTVLAVVAVALIIVVVVYFVRYRKVSNKKNKK